MRNHNRFNALLVDKRIAETQWKEMFLGLLQGKLSDPEAKKFLLLASKREYDSGEMRGCYRAIRRLEAVRKISIPGLVDVCGTGGDGLETFNISTVSAFVIAGAGGFVAKHGNRSASSRVGSSDLMEALGVKIEVPFDRMLKALHKCRLAYFHAPFYHPSFSKIQSLRRELGIRTLFNLLGPLLNPVSLQFQMIGISNSSWVQPMASVLRLAGRKKAALIKAEDGLDELSTKSANDIFYMEGQKTKKFRLDPKKFGFSKTGRQAYQGGDLSTNKRIALGILEGTLRGPKQDVVLFNSGFALWLMGLAPSVAEGIEKSKWTIRTGRAYQVLQALREITARRN